MKESDFQNKLINKIKKRFPGAIVLKNDASYVQGIPDLTVFYKVHWCCLECKKSAKASENNDNYNQIYYVNLMNMMSYATFVYPENEEEVLDEMGRLFEVSKK